MRFDGAIHLGEVSGKQLRALLAGANETPATPFALRHGDFLVADGPAVISPQKRYRIAVTDWVARNPRLYPDTAGIVFSERPELRLKPLVIAALSPAAGK